MNRRSESSAGAVLGALLVLAGLLYLAARYLPVSLGDYGWPLFVIVPGLVMLAFAVAFRTASGLAIPGSIVTVVGMILAVQNTFGVWASWTYAWALVVPGALGLGIAIKGVVDGSQKEVQRGAWIAFVGVALFAIFGLFFEGALRVSGINFGIAGDLVVPVLLIAIGVALLVRTFVKPGPGPTKALL